MTLIVLDDGYRIVDVINTLFGYLFDRPANVLKPERDHYPMLKKSLGDGSDRVGRHNGVADLDLRGKLPLLIGDRIEIDAPFKEEAALFGEFRQRILKTVKHAGQKPRSEFYTHQFVGKFRRVADLYSFGHLVYLHTRDAVVDPDYLAFEFFIIDEDISDLVFLY